MAVAAPDEDDDDIEPTPLWRRRKVQIVAGGVGLLLLFLFTRGKPPTKPEDATGQRYAFIGAVVPYQSEPEPLVQKVVAAVPAPKPPAPTPAPTPAPVVAPAPAPPPPPSVRAAMPNMATIQPKAPARPIMLSYAVAVPKPAPPPTPEPETQIAFKTATIPGGKASPAMDTALMLMPGLLPLVLETAISSDVPSGKFIAHTPGPVYSPKGVLLLPAGTRVIGNYAGVSPGGNRLQAVGVYGYTPDGIFLPLTDNATDDLGRTGLDGSVDHRYVERFGAAILLQLSQSVLSIIQAEASKGGDTYLSLGNSGGSGVGGLAQQILQSTINLPPIFSKHEGETIALLISSPIDFSASYKIHQVKQ